MSLGEFEIHCSGMSVGDLKHTVHHKAEIFVGTMLASIHSFIHFKLNVFLHKLNVLDLHIYHLYHLQVAFFKHSLMRTRGKNNFVKLFLKSHLCGGKFPYVRTFTNENLNLKDLNEVKS